MVTHLDHVDVTHRSPGRQRIEDSRLGIPGEQDVAFADRDEQHEARLVAGRVLNWIIRPYGRENDAPGRYPVAGSQLAYPCPDPEIPQTLARAGSRTGRHDHLAHRHGRSERV